jgi:DNA-binding CsgD family transcriptional regulator
MPIRRLVTALLLALVFSSVGFAFAVSQSAPAPKPEPLTQVEVPPLHFGDRGAYNLTLTGQWRYDEGMRPGNAMPGLQFEFTGRETIRDAAGSVREADLLEVRGLRYQPMNIVYDRDAQEWVPGPAWNQYNETLWLAAGATATLAHTSGYEDLEVRNHSLFVLPLQDRRETKAAGTAYGHPDHPVGTCGLVDDIPRILGANDTLELGYCRADRLDHQRVPQFFRPAGEETIGGIRVLKFNATDRHGSYALWYADGLPVPLRYEVTQENDLDRNRTQGTGTFRLDLVAFERGQTPRDAGGQPGPPLPALAREARQPWGLSGGKHELPFPAKEAWDFAAAEVPEMRRMLASSPDAYVARAHLSGWVEPNDADLHWFFSVVNGTHVLDLMVEKRMQMSVIGFEPMLLPGTPWALHPASLKLVFTNEWEIEGYYPPPEQAPNTVATLDALLERHEAYLPDVSWGDEDIRYGFTIMCATIRCDDTRIYYDVGISDLDRRYVQEQAPPGLPRLFGMRFAWSYFMVQDDGLALASYSMQDDSGTAPASSAAQPVRSPPRVASALAAPTPSWVAPVATASAAGILVGLLYWLWPALKAAPAALFSRVRGEDLLRNPLRAEIHQRIEANPGIHHQELVRATGRGNGAIEHHLAKLVQAGLVKRIAGKGYTCYFLRGAADHSDMQAAPLLKSPVARRIVEAARGSPGIRPSEVARQVGVSPATVHYHVERLKQAGLLQATALDGSVRLHAQAA